jgi:hypothetical protein
MSSLAITEHEMHSWTVRLDMGDIIDMASGERSRVSINKTNKNLTAGNRLWPQAMENIDSIANLP